jgi:hypothetical protein
VHAYARPVLPSESDATVRRSASVPRSRISTPRLA